MLFQFCLAFSLIELENEHIVIMALWSKDWFVAFSIVRRRLPELGGISLTSLALSRTFQSPQLPRQVLRLQVRIPPQHAQILVPRDARHLHDVEALLEQPGGSLVTQVVEAEVFDVGPFYRTHLRALDGLGGDAAEDVTVQGTGEGTRHGDGGR